MAFADDLQQFVQDLLLTFDPTFDLSPGSPLQVKVVDPIVQRFGSDPFSTETSTFIRDRLLQEFPALMADNGGQLEDLLTNPLQMLFEPFKRAVQTVRTNQSVQNALLMADAEADALGANFFEDRQEGDFASGPVRIFFAAPTTARVTTDKRLSTNSGLTFFPVQNLTITSAQMLFQRFGNLFFLDISVRAEQPGEVYNVDANEISAIDDVPGVVRVANLSKFVGGAPRESNEEYLGRLPQALTERSLVTKRGVTARVPNLFSGVRALQIVGAGEVGMGRDVLEGAGEGFLHLVGDATLYGDWLLVSVVRYKDDGPSNNVLVQVGDLLRFQRSVTADPAFTIYEAKVATVFPINVGVSTEQYLIIMDKAIITPASLPTAGRVSVFKPGIITISGIPGGIAANIQVPDGSVHLGGHTDVFVRPTADVELQAVLPNITDAAPFLALLDLKVSGTPSVPDNLVESRGIPDNGTPPTGIYTMQPTNFVTAGVRPGDILVIETGDAIAGTYTILSVGSKGYAGDTDYQLRVNGLIGASGDQLRARILRSVTVDLVEPKTPKLPFETGQVSDLQTTVGSALFRFSSRNIQDFGAVVGDVIRVLDGLDTGDFIIQSFDPTLGGQGAVVDRIAAVSGAGLRYQVFTRDTGLELPLVRLKRLEVLDSTNQGTGIVVPYGDAVDIRPTCDFDGAGREVRVLDRQIFVVPDASGLWEPRSTADGAAATGAPTKITSATIAFDAGDVGRVITLAGAGVAGALYTGVVTVIDSATQVTVSPVISTTVSGSALTLGYLANDPATPGAGVDARFSQKLVTTDGIIRKFSAAGANPITTFEVNLPPFLYNGKRDTLLAFTTRPDPLFTADPLGDNRTSDVAESKVGDTISILDGPNQGNYLIKDLRVLDTWAKSVRGHRRVALVQVEPELPVDPVHTAMRFTKDQGTGPVTATDLLKIIEYSTDVWDPNSSSFWDIFNTKLRAALIAAGFTITLADVKTLMTSLALTGYSVGPAATGTLRVFFQEPVTVQLFFDEDPTVFQVANDPSKQFRLALDTPPAQIFPESEDDAPPTEWNRNSLLRSEADFPHEVISPTDLAINGGASFPARGILAGDTFEFHRAVNDLLARKNMQSSFLCITRAGSNIVRLVLPNNPDNKTSLQAGQLLFIDSGPDTGAYYIIRIIGTPDFSSTITNLQVQLDKLLSHSTLDFPVAAKIDFGSNGCPASLITTTPIIFPTAAFALEQMNVLRSIDGGISYTSAGTHIFDGAYATIDDMVAELNGDVAFNAAGLLALNDGDSLIIRSSGAFVGAKTSIRWQANVGGEVFGPAKITSSPGFTAYGGGAIAQGGTKKLYANAFSSGATVLVGDYISIYAAQRSDIFDPGLSNFSDSPNQDLPWLGTFKVTAVTTETVGRYKGVPVIAIDRSENFPDDFDNAGADFPEQGQVRWIVHGAPSQVPTTTVGGGTRVVDEFVRFRMYAAASEKRTISIPWIPPITVNPLDPASAEQITLSGAPSNDVATYGFAYMIPYRILRAGLRKISSTKMATHRQGALYFLDLPVVGYGPGVEMNISEETGFILAGHREIAGYALQVEDENFTFSSQERVSVVLPVAVLPVGSTPDLDNEIPLSGQNIQVTYNSAPLIADVQRFFDSPLDRTVVANVLVRHFAPGYVYLDASYVGGSGVTTVAVDLIKYINNIDPDDNTLHADQIVGLIQKRSASDVNLPIVLIALFHGIDRKIRGMRSTNSIGPSDVPLFKGTFKQAYFIAGPDTSLETTRPNGEQVFLIRV